MPKLTFLAMAMAFVLSMLSLFMIAAPQPAQAQSLQAMSCNDLWYERNRIYAQKGYCFKTQRARSAFGSGCYPPYGRLNAGELRRVGRIKRQEWRMGCRAGGQAVIPQPGPPPMSNYASMSCADLWYERNSIYARNGQCFKSARARATFGAGCFPPYGRLGRTDQGEVNEILIWEGRKGCR